MTKTHETLLAQATTPLQTFILLAQLQILRSLESRRGSAEAILTFTLFLGVLALAVLLGFALAAARMAGVTTSMVIGL